MAGAPGRLVRMPSQSSPRAAKPRKRRLSKRQRQMYRRRRIAVLVGLVAFLALGAFCVYSLVRGASLVPAWVGADERMAVTRATQPPVPVRKSKVRVCSANDIELALDPASTSVPVGGSLEFTARITYTGKDPAGCYVDGADDGRVLQISSGSDVVWRSDACEAAYRPLLMMQGVTDEQKMTWDTVRSGSECVAEGDLPHVDRGTYVAQLVLQDDPKVMSKPVTITVE